MASVEDVLILLFSTVLGVSLKILYDELRSPWLQGDGFDRIGFGRRVAVVDSFAQGVLPRGPHTGIRFRVRNLEKPVLNAQAQNCVAWLRIDGHEEKFQVSWVPDIDSVPINVGDFRYVDLCARDHATGRIVAPTERGYFDPEPRIIGDGTQMLSGHVIVTCGNGHSLSQRIRIIPVGATDLRVEGA